MKYFVIETASVNHGAIAKAITEKDTLDEAKMLFHQVRASALANPDVTYSLCEVIDEAGGVYSKEWSGSTIVPPEPSVDETVPETVPETNPETSEALK